MKQNVTNTIEVSSISEVQVLNLMKNVANLVTELEINFGDLEDEDRRKKEVDITRESLHNAMRALGVMHAYEVETSAKIKADTTKETEENAKK